MVYTDYFIDRKGIDNVAHSYLNTNMLVAKDVVQAAAGRTGSTVLYRVLSYVFRRTWKTHSLIDVPSKVFMSFRDPRYRHLSYWKLENPNRNPEVNDIIRVHVSEQVDLKKRYLDKYGDDLILLKYEDFSRDFSKIYKAIETAFECVLPDPDKEIMDSLFSREATKAMQANQTEASLHKTQIHHNHIAPSITVSSDVLNKLTDIHEREMKELGYL